MENTKLDHQPDAHDTAERVKQESLVVLHGTPDILVGALDKMGQVVVHSAPRFLHSARSASVCLAMASSSAPL